MPVLSFDDDDDFLVREPQPQQGPPIPTPDQQRQSRMRDIARKVLETRTLPPSMERMQDSFTLGLRRPANALATALGGEVGEWFGGEPATFGERWSAGEDAYSDWMNKQAEEGGALGTVASVAGGLVSGQPVKNVIPSLKAAIGSSAALGGIEAGARAEGDLGERAKEAAIGAGVGGTVAGAVGSVGRVGSNYFANRAERKAIEQIPDDLRFRSKKLYDELDQAGVGYAPGQMQNLETSALGELRNLGYDPLSTQHAPVKDAIDRIGRLREAGANGSTSLNQIQNLRSDIGAIASSPDPAVRRLAGPLMGEIDDFIAREQPQQGMLSPDDITSKWGEARDMWRRKGKVEDVLYQTGKAERRAATANSGQNEENAIRQNVRGMLDREMKPGSPSRYSAEERKAMEKVTNGTFMQNRLREIGNIFGPTGALTVHNVAGLGGLPGAGMMMGLDPATSMALGGIGYAGGRLARRQSNNMAQESVNELMRLIGTGSDAPLVQRGPTREALAAILAANAAREGGRH